MILMKERKNITQITEIRNKKGKITTNFREINIVVKEYHGTKQKTQMK